LLLLSIIKILKKGRKKMYNVYNEKNIKILENISYQELIILIKEFKKDFENKKLKYEVVLYK